MMTSNAIKVIEERNKRTNLDSKLSSPHGIKSPTSASLAKGEFPGDSSVASQDSSHTNNSVASRRQRIIALSKAAQQRRAKVVPSPKNDSNKPRSWESPKAKAPESIDTNQSNTILANPMENYGGKEQSSCFETRPPPSPSPKYGISGKVRSFQRDVASPSPPPPPPPPLPETQHSASEATDAKPVNKFKAWSDWERGNQNASKVVAYPPSSPSPSWKYKVEPSSPVQPPRSPRVVVPFPPSPTASVERGNQNASKVVAYPSSSPSWKRKVEPSSPVQPPRSPRVVVPVPPSPTASVGSVDSSSFRPPTSTTSRNSTNKQTWNRPQNFSSPKYGSPQPRFSTGSRASIESYKNMLKPIKNDSEDVQKSHEKESYGAIIETPQKSSVSNLHAMFDSQKSTPLMPMNSTNSSVRQSLAGRSPVTTPSSAKAGGSAGRFRSFNDDDRSVSSVSSATKSRPPIVASWNQKKQAVKNKKKEDETSQKSSVSNLHAMFDSQKSTPLMPMNSTNSSVRQNLVGRSPVTTPSSAKAGGSAGRFRSFNDDDRSVSSMSSATKSRPTVVASWNQKQQAVKNEKKEEKSRVGQYYNASWRMQSPVNHETSAQDSSVRSTDAGGTQVAEASAPSQFSIAQMMYSQNVNSQQRQKDLRATMDWPTVTNEKPTSAGSDVEDSVTDIILDSLTDVIPNDLQLPPMLDSRPQEQQSSQEPLKATSAGVKPWENDTKHSIVQSWQNHASKTTDSALPESSENETEIAAAPNGGNIVPEGQCVGNGVEDAPIENKNEMEVIVTKSSSDSFIEEKKSNDLSFDENEILGDRSSQEYETNAERSQHGGSTHHPRSGDYFYDDDSYLSRGDATSRGLAASGSMRSSSGRSRNLGTKSSEDLSVYVEDERIITKTEDKILSAQLEQMNLEIAVGESGSKEDKEIPEANATDIATEADPMVKPTLPRLNPSPKDNDQYINKFFEDSGDPTAKTPRGNRANRRSVTPVGSLQRPKSTEKQMIDIWATTSEEERNEAISFDDTDQWLDHDPEVADDVSSSSERENTEPLNPQPVDPLILRKKPRDAFVSPEKQKQRAKAMSSSKSKQTPNQQVKQEVFDPFGTDAEEEGGLTVEISDDLFASNPDPFMTAESFSPLEWSGSPRESNTKTNRDTTRSHQHIGYYHESPDSRVEI